MLTVTNLSVRYGEFPAVAGISFNVSRGEFVSSGAVGMWQDHITAGDRRLCVP
jgi:ABC-type uncharacterized transport system ATPase subunit